MQNNSRNYSGISHALFLHPNIIPFSGCLGSGFIYLPRNDIIKQVTFWGKSDLYPFSSLPFYLHLSSLIFCLPALENSSTHQCAPQSRQRETEKKKTNEMLSWEKGRSRSKDKIKRKDEKIHNTGRYMPIPSFAKMKIETNRDKK